MVKLICIFLIFIVSCKAPHEHKHQSMQPQLSDVQKMLYIEVEGKKIKIIEDEYGNYFMKQPVDCCRFIYIPFKHATKTNDSIYVYQDKTK